jgi:hypothetical protein
MPEMSPELPKATTIKPIGKENEIVTPIALDKTSFRLSDRKKMIPLFEYLQKADGLKRGTEGGGKDLNSHLETFIVKENGEIKLKDLNELQEMFTLGGLNVEVMGVHSIANKGRNQVVSGTVQDVDKNNSSSGYERPTIAEGPHMILGVYAKDKDGKLHIFRTVQMRGGQASVDTFRGFADSKTLASGKHIYQVEGSEQKVNDNITKIVKEEGGEKFLNIKKVEFLGSHVVNKTFVTSPSALFAVEIDYDTFVKSKNVVTEEEAKRQKEQFEHEGITDIVVDMTVEEYEHYKTNPAISKDMAADSATDTILIRHLQEELEKQKSASQVVLPHEEKKIIQFPTQPKKGNILDFFRRKKAA